MKRLLAVILALCPISVAAAKSTTTVHHQSHPGALYLQLSAARWRVGFNGVGPFDAAEVRTTVLRTAADRTVASGFDWFQPIGERAEPVETVTAVDLKRTANAPPHDLYLKWAAACPAGWSFNADPALLCKGAQASEVRPFQATTQIIMGHGQPPRNGMAMDARAILHDTEGEPVLTKARSVQKPWRPHIWPF